MAKSERYRNWVFIQYDDSSPADWREVLDTYLIPWCESPLHDKDVNPGTGELKKPHRHIVLAADGVKTFEQIKEITDSINATIPVKCHSLRGQVRYFAHLDNPEKYQYSVSDIIPHAGFDVDLALAPTASQRYAYVREMIRWCKDNEIYEFQDLMDYAMDDRFEDWFPLLCDNSAYIVSAYLRSARMRNVALEARRD